MAEKVAGEVAIVVVGRRGFVAFGVMGLRRYRRHRSTNDNAKERLRRPPPVAATVVAGRVAALPHPLTR